MTATSRSSSRTGRRRADATPEPPRSPGRFRWRRIPGRLILAACFLVGAVALGAAVLPFTTTNADGVELHCGPAVFEVLMPADPAFDDIPENVGCATPSKNRLIIAGGALAGAIVVAALTERRTRRGSAQRDTRWLSSTAKGRKARRSARLPALGRSKAPASRADADAALPPSRR